MASKELITRLIDLVEECTQTEISDLVTSSDWGSINFNDAIPDLERLFAICNHFKVLPLEQLPDDVAQHIIGQGNPVKDVLTNIRDFSIEQSDPAGVRTSYINTLKQTVDAFYKAAHIYVPYLAYQKGEIQRNIQNLTQSVEEANGILEETKKTTEKKKGEIEQIISAAREASASVGVAHFTGDFKTESETLEKTATKWLIASILLAIATVVVGFLFLNQQPSNLSVSASIQYVATKLIILGIFVTATIWCGNIYKATMHQVQTNKFKANSLKTFQAFVKAADDQAIRDAVLIETTRAIFNESATGYITGEPAGTEKSTKIVEVVKNGSQSVAAMVKANK